MLGAIAIVPSAPVLVPELAGAAAAEVADLSAAVLEAAALLPPRWIVIGTGRADDVLGPDGSNSVGTFAGFGVDVRVRLSPRADQSGELPLCALMAAWVRGQAQPGASAQVRVYRNDQEADAALALGRQLRAEIDRSTDPIGVLVVADGANTLAPNAPGGYQPEDAGRPIGPRRCAGRRRCRRLGPAAPADPGAGGVSGAGGPGRARTTYRQGALPWSALRGGLLRGCLAAVRPLAIIGPTGTGKSQLALDVAERLGSSGISAEIVNADAMQLYRGMDIGTAKLSVADRRGIPHHQLDVLDVTETATVARYQCAAADDVEAIAARGAVPIVVGGSMLYVQSLLDDWSFPATDPAVRVRWEQRLAEVGVGQLHAELASRDPAAAAAILPTDARRTVRALEVVELTGQPFAASAPRIGAPRWDTSIIGLDCETTILDERLARRTDEMFDRGLVEEVRALLRVGLRDGVTASRALGYAQVIAALDAGGDAAMLTDARQQTYFGTRRYVRRQRSWFRRDHRIHWLDAGAAGAPAGVADQAVHAWRHVS